MQRTNVAATSSPLTPVASTPHRLRAALSPRSTPGSFRLTAAVVTAICALCAVVAAAAIVARAGSLNGAGTEAQQLVALQEIRTATVEADAIAASSFLGGSEASATQQVDYEARLGEATALLADVAQRATTSDLPNLAIANETLVRYAGLVEQARANNRQGFPVGASYQRQASDLLRTDFLPAIDAVDVASRDRLNDSLTESTRNGSIAVILLAVALVALLLASLLLMRRTRRLVNVPIAIGAVLVAAALVWTVAVVATTGSDVRNTVDTSLRGADALSRARTAAFDARSAESLTLINRGNGAANEADWQLANAEVVAAVDEACSATGDCFADLWAPYQTDHQEVRALDDGGNYDGAVELATGPAAATFDAFTNEVGLARTDAATAAAVGFDDAKGPLEVLRWFVLAAGLIAAATVLVGFGQRLREYR